MKLAIVYGTRPEVIKLAPVVQELRTRKVEPLVIATGQHDSLLRGTPFEDVMAPGVNLALPSSNDPMLYASECQKALTKVFRENRPDVIVVQGDTASAYAGACVGKWLEIPVAHVEAGIRTGDPWDPFPEENFRVSIDGIAEKAFCATSANFENLGAIDPRAPGPFWDKPRAFGIVTGNTGIDALYSHTQPVEDIHKVDRVLITLHRRESFGDPLYQIACGVWAGAKRYPNVEVVWPVHPNPQIRKVLDGFGGLPQPGNLAYWHPMGTTAFAQQLAASRAVITDSGGVQEEAAALGIPCVVAREKTDRPESVELGLAKVVGRTEAGILQGLAWALETKIAPSDCFGDGKAAPRIVEHLLG